MRFRDLFNCSFDNSNFIRSLNESILIPEVDNAFDDWKKSTDESKYVVIGGIALSYYSRPRTTTDVDVLFVSKSDIPIAINNFKKHRTGAFQHNRTHVEIEVLTPETINMPPQLAHDIYQNARIVDGIRVADIPGLIASKLGRFKLQDQADIESLLLLNNNPDFSNYRIPADWFENYNKLREQLKLDEEN